MRGGKKALSPVVATSLLILLVIVIALIIFLWSRGFISEQIVKFGQPLETLCESAKFKVAAVKPNGNNYNLEILNTGNINLHGFQVKRFYQGDSETKLIDFGIESGTTEVLKNFNRRNDLSEFSDRIEMYPILSGTVKGQEIRKEIVCSQEGYGVVINFPESNTIIP